ncbi:MAG: hypothetical protein PVH88_16235 [Ignavibacteria bacterium]|jgi:hypothetical protein
MIPISQTDFVDRGENIFYNFNLDGGFYYYWRVIVKNTDGEVLRFSSVFELQTQGAANITPIPSWPIGGATVYTSTPTVLWYLDAFSLLYQ